MIITIEQIKEKNPNIKDIKGKISRDIYNNKLFPLVKGLYETNGNIEGYKLAQFIYGPSYLSFDYVLYYYGLIPETVYKTYTCATYNKRKIKSYNNHFGTYIYRDVPKDVFNLDVSYYIDGDYCYHMASLEKAICDKLYTLKALRSMKDFESLLFDDLRFDRYVFERLDKDKLIYLASMYKSNNLNLLIKLLKREVF